MLMWVLGIECQPFTRVASALDHWVTSLVSRFLFLNLDVSWAVDSIIWHDEVITLGRFSQRQLSNTFVTYVSVYVYMHLCSYGPCCVCPLVWRQKKNCIRVIWFAGDSGEIGPRSISPFVSHHLFLVNCISLSWELTLSFFYFYTNWMWLRNLGCEASKYRAVLSEECLLHSLSFRGTRDIVK